jgi:citrate synthase
MSEGLEGVVAASTRLSQVDGEAGRLIIAGYAVDDLAPAATFEQVAYLLLNGRLPDPDESTTFAHDLAARRELPHAAIALLREAAAANTKTMDALRMATPVLSLGSREDPVEDAMTAIAAFPTIVGTYWRIRRGESPAPVRTDLGHAAHYLQQLSGSEPTPERARALETYLNTVCDHGLNASTFAARVIVSTKSDVISAIGGAVGALKGPLHGGAPQLVMDMLDDIGTVDNIQPWIDRTLDSGGKLMGFGHRVYRTTDPRAEILREMARQASTPEFFALAKGTEDYAIRVLNERKPERRLYTNVEFYSATVLNSVGLPRDLYPPTFAISRMAGWTAHILEQLVGNRLIRPQSEYGGEQGLKYVTIDQR